MNSAIIDTLSTKPVVIVWIIYRIVKFFGIYGHRLLKTRLPVRSAKDKPQIG